MMKGFLKNGKWIGLLAVGLLFAGCYGGSGDSSSESALPTNDQLGTSYFPMTVDPANKTLTLGDGSGTAVAGTAEGEPVLLMNDGGVAACGGAGDDVQCSIRIVNQSADKYMANAAFVLTACATCDGLGAQIDNADLLNGVTLCDLNGSAEGDGCASITAVNGVGFCIVEDGDYGVIYPSNVHGCSIVTTPNNFTKPNQILHPECGSRKVFVDFSGTVSQYNLLGAIANLDGKTLFFPQDPNGDGRMDMTHFSTWYVMVTDLGDGGLYGGTLGGTNWLRPGSYRRSAILSGWNETGANSLALGTNFAVNVALEYSDQIEGQDMASATKIGSGYVYPASFGFVLRYNKEAVTRTDGNMYRDWSMSGPALPTFDNLSIDSGASLDNQAAGYISVSINADSDFFLMNHTALGTAYYYSADFGGSAAYMTGGAPVCAECRHYGIANKMMGNVFSPGYGVWLWSAQPEDHNEVTGAGIVKQQGADAAPDQPLAMFLFTAAGASGVNLGSQFFIETHSTASKLKTAYTLGSLIPSGIIGDMGGPAADWTNLCWTQELGLVESCGALSPTDVGWIVSSNEALNLDVHHGGFAKPDQAMQQWHAHICVQ